jgi:hypothetical protein
MEYALVGVLGYLVWSEWNSQRGESESLMPRKRVCDYHAAGAVFEDLSTALARGIRLIELHVYSDEQGYPVVANHPVSEGYDYALDNVSFESCCVTLVNEAFPSKHPLILSIVSHTENAVTLNRVAEHLKTTLRKHLVKETTGIPTALLDRFADRVIVVSGGNFVGTELEPLVNLSWSGSDLRRLTYSQTIHSRDQAELVAYNRDHITMVAPDPVFGKSNVNPDTVLAYGCQWTLVESSRVQPGFVEKSAGLQ